MRLTTWNVNGIRNPFSYAPWSTPPRTFPRMFDTLGADIVVMQELKIQRKDLNDDMVLLDGWDAYFSLPQQKKGYSGVGVYVRTAVAAPIRAEEGVLGVLPSVSEGGGKGKPYCELEERQSIGGYLSEEQLEEVEVDPTVLDAEGRCVVLEFPAFVLLGVYAPANSNGMRDDFRWAFHKALDFRIRNLTAQGKRVILCGDLNVSRCELDVAGSLDECRKAGMSHEEYMNTPNRRIFNQLLVDGEVVGSRDAGRETAVLWDTTRGFHEERKGMYTHWEQKINARPGNYGSRIDYVLVSPSMRSWIKDANIQEGLMGSDHCPVFVEFEDMVTVGVNRLHLLDIMNSSGMFEDGKRRLAWKVLDAPTFSAKKMPEFDRRRSIKSMFTAPTMRKSQPSYAEEPTQPAHDGEDLVSQIPDNSTHSTRDEILKASQPEQPALPAPVQKRKLSTPTAKERTLKRQKSEVTAPSAATKGQQSLKGFFQTKEKPIPNGAGQGESADSLPATKAAVVDPAEDKLPADRNDNVSPDSPSIDPASPPSPSISEISSQLANVEQTQSSWSKLFAKPVSPLCEGHQEPCKTMQTKKKGSNQGRSFWMCARPLGPSGQKERGTQWRCGTFIWCSDWGGGKKGEG